VGTWGKMCLRKPPGKREKKTGRRQQLTEKTPAKNTAKLVRVKRRGQKKKVKNFYWGNRNGKPQKACPRQRRHWGGKDQSQVRVTPEMTGRVGVIRLKRKNQIVPGRVAANAEKGVNASWGGGGGQKRNSKSKEFKRVQKFFPHKKAKEKSLLGP